MAKVSDKPEGNLFPDDWSVLNIPTPAPPRLGADTINFQGRPKPQPAPGSGAVNIASVKPPPPGQSDPPRRPPYAPYSFAQQDLLDRTNSLIQESLARQYDADQRQVENERLAKAREFDPSPSPTPSISTDEGHDPAEFWHEDQVALNVILNARNEYSLMPSTWRISLRGIPLPEGLFYTKTRDTASRPRIYAHTDRLEYRGVQALRKLIDVHGRISDLRDKQVEVLQDSLKTPGERQRDERVVISDIAKQLKKTLREAMNWAATDGALDVYGEQLPPNLQIINLTRMTSQNAMRTEITERLNRMADDWADTMERLPGFATGEDKPDPPVIFGLVIYKHILFIATLDAGDFEAVEHIPTQLNMGEKNQHQWNALAIMLTICWARDILMKTATAMKLKAAPDPQLSDPDA